MLILGSYLTMYTNINNFRSHLEHLEPSLLSPWVDLIGNRYWGKDKPHRKFQFDFSSSSTEIIILNNTKPSISTNTYLGAHF
jgi:hypothetical protein